MDASTEYFELIKKLEKDPEFCFSATNAGKEFMAYATNSYGPAADKFKSTHIPFLQSCNVRIRDLQTDTERNRKDFFIEDENHPSYKQCLQTISVDPKWSLVYAYFRQKRFALGEPVIAQDALYSYLYANRVINSRFELGEETISKDEKIFIAYVKDVLGSRFNMAEPLISKNPRYSAEYAAAIKGRFELGEPAIASDPSLSYWYAEQILKGRFEMGETAISTDENLMLKYARNIMKGKLPEDMHHVMIGKKLAA
jgi:hypothetical protein